VRARPLTSRVPSDQEEVRKLQYKYGYYLDKCLYKEVRETPQSPCWLCC